MNKAQHALKERIQHVYRQSGGFFYITPEWDDTLWSKSTDDIRDYIMNRFETTTNEVEYYVSLIYLISPNPKYDHLLVEWKDSINYQRVLESLSKEDIKNDVIKTEKTVKPAPKNNVKIITENNKNPQKKDKNVNKIKKTITKTINIKKSINSTSITKNFI